VFFLNLYFVSVTNPGRKIDSIKLHIAKYQVKDVPQMKEAFEMFEGEWEGSR
jgi:hypothetical protein